jgi:putative transposase
VDKSITLKYLDETGFGLMLSVICSWFKRGKGKQFRVPTRWGSEGRLNVIGVWSIHGEDTHLEYRLLEGSCKQPEVVSFLRWQAAVCDPERPTVIVLEREQPARCCLVSKNNATFHRGRELKALKNEWESQGLVLRYLPSHCPFLNVIEGVWRVAKGFLMPRRCYNSVDELRAAVLVAFGALRAVEV